MDDSVIESVAQHLERARNASAYRSTQTASHPTIRYSNDSECSQRRSNFAIASPFTPSSAAWPMP